MKQSTLENDRDSYSAIIDELEDEIDHIRGTNSDREDNLDICMGDNESGNNLSRNGDKNVHTHACA